MNSKYNNYYVVGLTTKVDNILKEKYNLYYFNNDIYLLSIVAIADILSIANATIADIEVYIEDKENYTEKIEDFYVRQVDNKELLMCLKDVKIIDNIEDFENNKTYALIPVNEALEEELEEEYTFEDYILLYGEDLKDLLEDFQISSLEAIIYEYENGLKQQVAFTNGIY